MRKNESHSIGDLIRQYFRQESIEAPLNEFRLKNMWTEVLAEVAGAEYVKYTGQLFIRNQTLYVQITSPALRQNLSMSRTRLLNRLNEKVGSQVIYNIIFR